MTPWPGSPPVPVSSGTAGPATPGAGGGGSFQPDLRNESPGQRCGRCSGSSGTWLPSRPPALALRRPVRLSPAASGLVWVRSHLPESLRWHIWAADLQVIDVGENRLLHTHQARCLQNCLFQVTGVSHFFSNIGTENGGAKEIRTPDLLHAIQARPIARWCQTSPYGPFTCGDSGWVWPDAAWQLASLAPNLAPRHSGLPGRRRILMGAAD
jgi:hypothetical protein